MSSAKKKQERDEIWLEVVSPEYLGGKVIGNILAYSDEEIFRKRIEILQSDLTDDPAHAYTKIILKVSGVSGGKAITEYVGHEVSRDYMKSILRKGSSKVDPTVDVTTKDGYKFRMRINMIARNKISTNKKTVLSNQVAQMMVEKCSSYKLPQLVQEMISGKTESDIFNFAKKHMRVKYAGDTKVKLISKPIEQQKELAAKAA